MQYPEPLIRLISLLGRLPGIGRRSAERIALKIARDSTGLVQDLGLALRDVQKEVATCSICGNISLRNENPCRLCLDPRRERDLLCIVEDAGDIGQIEKTGEFKGRYFSLGGKLSPMEATGPGALRLQALQALLDHEPIGEVILALNSDVESDATASYLAHLLAGRKIKVSRLAFGIPAGSAIVYSDPVTLSRAIQGRQVL